MTAAEIVTVDDLNSTYSIHEEHYHIIKETACRGQSIRSCLDRFAVTKLFFQLSGPWGMFYNSVLSTFSKGK